MGTVQVLLIIISGVFILFLCWRIYFLRDPKRNIPAGDVLVAPADGTVLYIKNISRGEIPIALKKNNSIPLTEITGIGEYKNTSGILIGIFMSPLSVHRNRIPVSGEIVFKKYQPAPFNLSMVKATTDILLKRTPFNDYDFYPTNERLTIGIKTEWGIISVTQIADKWIRKIVSWIEVGDKVTKGQQYGMIRFGSQCDIFIPDSFDIQIRIKTGDYMYAGETVLATYSI